MTRTLSFDVFWSMRSSFCYLALDQILEIREKYDTSVNLRPVYPVAVRDPDFFKTAPRYYRPYHLLDSQRVADFYAIPYRRPIPDPIVQDMETNAIAAEQPHVRRLTRLAAAAQEQGKALAFQDKVMRLLWDGKTDNWDRGTHLEKAIASAGLDANALMAAVDAEPERFDAIIEENQEAQAEAIHSGVPLFVFEGEPFHGQDRLELLVWRMKHKGLTPR